MLNGIANGTCVGGMLNEVELRYAFGPGDPTGTLYCGLEYVGQPSVATFQFAIPFTADTTRLSAAAFNSINEAMDLYLYSGNYTIYTAAKYLAVRSESKCAPYLSQFKLSSVTGGVAPLSVTDLAGVFLFMGGTGVVCLCIATAMDKDRTLETLAAFVCFKQPKATSEENDTTKDAEAAELAGLAALAAAEVEMDNRQAGWHASDAAELTHERLCRQLAEKDAMLHLLLRRMLAGHGTN